jgi:nitroreductase
VQQESIATGTSGQIQAQILWFYRELECKEESLKMDFFEVLLKKRACRDFTSESVPKEKIDRLLKAAKRAPTASNIPYRHYVFVDDKRVIKAIREISPSFMADPPVVLVIFSDLRIALEKTGRVAEFSSLVDAGASGENVLLAATELGLGSQFTMISHMAGIRKVLALPDYCRVDLIIPLGYAKEGSKSTKARTGANIVYHNQYGDLYE